MDDYDGPNGVEAADMETHIPASNVGYKLLLKMGWKAGTGLGVNATGELHLILLFLHLFFSVEKLVVFVFLNALVQNH
jgi:hypothetical protein